MSEFIPAGYIPSEKYKEQHGFDVTRCDLEAGKIIAYGWDKRTGALNPFHKGTWLADWSLDLLKADYWEEPVQDRFGRRSKEKWPLLIAPAAAVRQTMPAPEYISPFLEMMLAATAIFKITATGRPPKKDDIEAHFLKQKLPNGSPVSPSQAKMMATFIRPPHAMKGGLKKVG
jgi:hypothetical protein